MYERFKQPRYVSLQLVPSIELFTDNYFIFKDCSVCYDEIFAATIICKGHNDIITCIQNELGTSNPCYECICEVIEDIADVFGQDWHC